MPRTPVPFCVVIFGASGDLTKRKLVPALYALAAEGSLPAGFTVVGAGRSALSDEEFRADMREGVEKYGRIPLREDVWERFAAGLRFAMYDLDAADGFDHLKSVLDEADRDRGTAGNRLLYFSTPPNAVLPLAEKLNAAGLTTQAPGTFVRAIIEKPFGRDLATARALNAGLHTAFVEEQIYRIDHYLGKETVQNLLVFRFANGIFEPLWNRQYIDHVQITVAEEIGVEGRGSYYEEAGALRDIVQNHIMQLVAIVGMEAPSNFQAEMVRDEKVKLLRAVRPIHPDDALSHSVRGQYSAGYINGQPVPGYREEKGVAPDSLRETFVALKVDIDNWRWAGNAVLSAHGQAAAEALDGDRHPVPPRAAFPLCRQRAARRRRGAGGRYRAQPAHPAHPARRGHHASLRREDSRAGAAHRVGEHGLHVRNRLPRTVAGCVRAPPPRLHARRPDSLRARGRGRRGVAVLHRDPRRLARASARPDQLPELPCGHVGSAGITRVHGPRRTRLAYPLT